MNSEKKYKHLEVTNKLVASKAKFDSIHAKHLYLENTELKSHIDVNNYAVKEAYESNKNTNAFTDDEKTYVSDLRKGFDVNTDTEIYSSKCINLHGENGTIFKIPTLVEYDDIPDGYGAWCIDPEIGLILKYKHKGKLMYHAVQSYEWNFPVTMSVNDDENSVSIKI